MAVCCVRSQDLRNMQEKASTKQWSKLRNKYMETHTKVEFAIMEMLHLADTFSVKNGLVLSGIKNFVVVVVIVIVAGLSMLAFPLNIGGLANIN